MPLLTYPGEENAPMSGFEALGSPTPADPAPDPSTWEAAGAAFRQSNIIGSFAVDKTRGIDFSLKEDGFTGQSVWDQIKGTKYEPYWERFATAHNTPAFSALKSQIDMEQDDKLTTDAAGWTGTGLNIAASFFDLPTLIPGGALFNDARLGVNVARSAVSTGIAGALGAGVSEVALQASQQTRPIEQSVTAVGAGALFSALLGAGAATWLTHAERGAAVRTFDRARTAIDESDTLLDDWRVGAGASVGAARVDAKPDTLADLSIAGKSAQVIGKTTSRLNPVLRAAHSPSLVHRGVMADLQETGFYLTKNMQGEGNVAVETAVKFWERGALADVIGSTRDIYSRGRKAGLDMTRTEFGEAVGRAMRRNDVGENEWVTQAAKSWRSKLFDPLKNEAINAKLLGEDVHVTTAASYLSRIYKTKLIEAEEGAFKGITKQWVRGQIDAAQEAAGRAAAKGEKTDVLDFVSEADKQGYVDQIADDVFNKITGRSGFGEPSYRITMAARGPLKERTFQIPDALIERYLESDVDLIGRRYARIMSADVELAKKFGKPTMEEQISKVREDYTGLRLKAAADQKAVVKLNAQEKRDVTDIEGVRDLLRGQYKTDIQHTNFARVLQTAGTFNYLRTMGGVLFGNLNDAFRPVMTHGLTRYMGEGIGPLMTNLKAVKMSVGDARIMGAVTERVLQSRISDMAGLADPYAMRSPFERLLTNMSTTFTKMTLLPWFNDMNKSITSVLTQNRILKNAMQDFGSLKPREQAYMGFLGINKDMAGRIDAMFQKFGDVDGTVHIANVDHWTDGEAVRAYAAALNKDVDTTIVSKGAGDIPLSMNTPAGKALGQFKSFILASNQRMLMRGVQEGPGSVITGMIGMSSIGILQYWLKGIESGREIDTSPGKVVAEGLDRSGFFSIAFEINNIWEKLGGDGLYSLASRAAGGEHDAASRFQSRNTAEALAGPTFGLVQDLLGTVAVGARVQRAARGDQDVKVLSPADIAMFRRLAPYASLPWFRWLVDGGFGMKDAGFKGIVPEAKEAVQ